MENSQISMLEIAINLMKNKRKPQSIRKLITEVLEVKGLEDLEGELATQLYLDITTSSSFVYMGNEEWDLKIRQSLDEFDKDGAAFNTKEDLLEAEAEIAAVLPVDTFDEEEEEEMIDDIDDIDDIMTEEDFEEDTTIDVEEELVEVSDDEENPIEDESLREEFMDEDKYNDYMDSYEDMYDE